MVAIGMLITVPIIIYGSTLFVKVIERFPIILYVGGGILGWVGAGMAVEDTLIAHSVEPYALFIKIAAVILVVGASLIAKKTQEIIEYISSPNHRRRDFLCKLIALF